eukprot:GHUV01050147.1.p1 GENE.GHUV01050147.1~~GHUV01050147.1.p1  ORF type:complete len:148 (+),score=9.39 GHUV01050147.1:273-716(+)
MHAAGNCAGACLLDCCCAVACLISEAGVHSLGFVCLYPTYTQQSAKPVNTRVFADRLQLGLARAGLIVNVCTVACSMVPGQPGQAPGLNAGYITCAFMGVFTDREAWTLSCRRLHAGRAVAVPEELHCSELVAICILQLPEGESGVR